MTREHGIEELAVYIRQGLVKLKNHRPEFCDFAWANRDAMIRALSSQLEQYAATICALRARNEALTAEKDELAKQVYVPGLWKCAKCKCTVVSTLLDANSGRFAANHEPQQCPNDCGPMWRVTEREGGNNVADALDRMLERAEAAESTIATANTRIAEVEAERDAHIQSWLAERAAHGQTLARTESLERQNELHVLALQEIGKGVEADQATIARLTAERDNALADADNDRSLAASRQREAARLSEELAQAQSAMRWVYEHGMKTDHERPGEVSRAFADAWSAVFGARHRARHDTEGR